MKLKFSILVCASLLCCGICLANAFAEKASAKKAPKRDYKISRGTTYFTDFRKDEFNPDGSPNYVKYLNRKNSEGIKPADNALALFYKAMGKAVLPPKPSEWDEDEEEDEVKAYKKYLQHLEKKWGVDIKQKGQYKGSEICGKLILKKGTKPGFPTFSKPEIKLIRQALKTGKLSKKLREKMRTYYPLIVPENYEDWDKDQWNDFYNIEKLPNDLDFFFDIKNGKLSSIEEFPPQALMVIENHQCMETIAKAVRKKSFFVPLFSQDTNPPRMISCFSSSAYFLMSMSDLFCKRAELRTRAGDTKGALADFEIAWTLPAMPLRQKYTSILQLLLSINALEQVQNTAKNIITSGKLNKAELAQIKKILKLDLANIATLKNAFTFERVFGLDSVFIIRQSIKKGDSSNIGMSDVKKPKGVFFDSNISLRQVNGFYDKVNLYLNDPTQNYPEYKPLTKKQTNWLTVEMFNPFASKKSRSRAFTKIVGNLVMTMLAPSLGGVQHLVERKDCETTLVKISIALEEYKLDKGKYPAALDQLVTGKYLETLPYDPFNTESKTPKPFTYKIKNGIYIVYSFGLNCKDDEGQHWQSKDKPNSDDLYVTNKKYAKLK